MAQFRLGCSAIRWSREAEWEDILDKIAEIGYEGTEVQQAFQADSEADMQKVKDQFASRNLIGTTVYVAGAYYDAEKAGECLDKVREGCKRMKALDGEIIVVAASGGPTRAACAGAAKSEDMLTGDQFKVLAETLNKAGEICKEHGMTACYHNHAATFVESPEEIDRLMEMTSPDLLALNPDTGHLCVGGYDCVEFFQKYAPRIKYVHLKSCNAEALEQLRKKEIDWMGFARGSGWAELRDGCIDLPTVFDELKKAGYEGWLMVEQDNSPNPPDVAAENNYAFLKEVV
ncbi:MAG: TIM barrel protein [Planctomycetes bacterium]|nr:TIM barrel protein [Planctomycetota bacterium]